MQSTFPQISHDTGDRMIKVRQTTNNDLNKSEIRDTVREALRLHAIGELDRESLETIAQSALAWEIIADLLHKIEKNQTKLDKKIAGR